MEKKNAPTKISGVRMSKHQRRRKQRETMASWSLRDAVSYLNSDRSKMYWEPEYVSRSVAARWVAERLGDRREDAVQTLRGLGASKTTRKICENEWRGLRKQEARRKEAEKATTAALNAADRISRDCGLPVNFSPAMEIQQVGAAPLLCCAIDAALDVLGSLQASENGEMPKGAYTPSSGLRYALDLFRKNAHQKLSEEPDISYKDLVPAIDHSMNLYAVYETASDLLDSQCVDEGEAVFSQDDTLLEVVYYVLLGAGGFCEELVGVHRAQDWVRQCLLHEPLIRVCCAKREKELAARVQKEQK